MMCPAKPIVLGLLLAGVIGAGVNTILPASRARSGMPDSPGGNPGAAAFGDRSVAVPDGGVTVAGAPAICAQSTAPDLLLDAVRDAESLGSDVSKPNEAGALGPYQIKADTWADRMPQVPWRTGAVDEPTARRCAALQMEWLRTTITDWQGSPATTEQVLGAWHSGIGTLRSAKYDWRKLGPRGRGFVEKVMGAVR